MNTVNILGTPYSITVKAYADDKLFEQRSITGYCDGYTKEIVICDMTTYPDWDDAHESADLCQKYTLRHEIVHAFLTESGLMDCSFSVDHPWAKNEEMIDWIALQGEKIYRAWQEAGAV